MGDRGEPRWQPISRLPELTAHIEQGVQLAAEHLATLQGAREQPYVLDDLTVARVTATFTQTRTDLVNLFAEQGRRWQALDLGATRRRDVDRFVDLVAQELDLVEQILTLAEELKAATIERMLAKSDLEIAWRHSPASGADHGGRARRPCPPRRTWRCPMAAAAFATWRTRGQAWPPWRTRPAADGQGDGDMSATVASRCPMAWPALSGLPPGWPWPRHRGGHGRGDGEADACADARQTSRQTTAACVIGAGQGARLPDPRVSGGRRRAAGVTSAAGLA